MLIPDLVPWLSAQIDEDERVAKAATPGPWATDDPWLSDVVGSLVDRRRVADCSVGMGYRDGSLGDAAHIACHDPLRVLAEVEAKRRLVEAIVNLKRGKTVRTFRTATGGPGTWNSRDHEDQRPALLRLLALPYADRPGYREEWRP
jgi:hypothetical protein